MALDNTSPSVAAYHRNITKHLRNLLQATSAASLSTPDHEASRPSGSSPASSSLSKVSSATSSAEDPRPITPIAEDDSTPADLTARPDQGAFCCESQKHSSPSSGAPRMTNCREEEQQAAWQAAGCKIYKSIPDNFNLVLSTVRSRRGSDESKAPKGLGIDLAVSSSQDNALRMGLVAGGPMKPLPLPIAKGVRKVASQSSFSVASTSASPNITSMTSSLARSAQQPVRIHTPKKRQGAAPLRDATALSDKDEEYEVRRQIRHKRKEAELRHTVMTWRAGVVYETLNAMPEIEPTPPTPSICTSKLRFSPFDASSAVDVPTAPFDVQVKLRALDALLGDMSLRQPSQSGSLKLRPLSPTPTSVKRLECSTGMTTPKADKGAAIAFG